MSKRELQNFFLRDFMIASPDNSVRRECASQFGQREPTAGEHLDFFVSLVTATFKDKDRLFRQEDDATKALIRDVYEDELNLVITDQYAQLFLEFYCENEDFPDCVSAFENTLEDFLTPSERNKLVDIHAQAMQLHEANRTFGSFTLQ